MTTATASLASRFTRPAAWLREGPLTSPGRLRLAAAVVTLAILGFGVCAFGAASARRDAARAAATQTEPLLIAAEGLYASLADADATAATTFVIGGLEPAVRRQRYLADLRDTSKELSTLARQGGGSPSADRAVRTIAAQLPIYAGAIESARANNRQGFPVGAAYLRQASSLMRAQILPAAASLYGVEATRLGADYRSGVSLGALILLVVVGVALLSLLLAAQVYVASLTRRIISIPIAVTTLVALALTVWSAVALTSEQNALAGAQRNGSDAVQLLAAARVLVLRAQGDESLALVARGGDNQDLADFNTATQLIALPNARGGLLAQAAAIAPRAPSAAAIDALSADVARYQALHRRVSALELNGDFLGALRLAASPGAPGLVLADRLNTGLEQQIIAAQQRFRDAAATATSATDGLTLALPLLTVMLVALCLFAFQQRLGEYR